MLTPKSSRLGSLRLGNNFRSVALVEPRLRHRSRGLLKLDVEFHRRADHAGYAAENHVWDIYLFWGIDVWGCGVCVVRGAGDEEADARGDGCVVWECGCCCGCECNLILLKVGILVVKMG